MIVEAAFVTIADCLAIHQVRTYRTRCLLCQQSPYPAVSALLGKAKSERLSNEPGLSFSQQLAKSLAGWVFFCSYNLPAESPQLLHVVVSKKVTKIIKDFLQQTTIAAAGAVAADSNVTAAAGTDAELVVAAGGSQTDQERNFASGRAQWRCPVPSELTATDKSWLDRHAVSVSCSGNVVAVAARSIAPASVGKNGGGRWSTPAVIKLYPLRFDPKNRGDRRGPVPWPNLYFLVCPRLIRAVGALEDAGWIQTMEAWLQADEALMKSLVDTHESYAAERWEFLTEEDRAYAIDKGYNTCLQDSGVCGLSYTRKIKCLHAQYAYHLARLSTYRSGTLVGRWVHEQICLQQLLS
eukprot:SAG31_NODE_2663_length_5278_cov_29.536011_4_plen_352_part_00